MKLFRSPRVEEKKEEDDASFHQHLINDDQPEEQIQQPVRETKKSGSGPKVADSNMIE
jgi:hypothetical protein